MVDGQGRHNSLEQRAGDYEAAINRAPERLPLGGAIPPTPWDPELSVTMTAAGSGIYEEQLRDEVLHVIRGFRQL